MRLSIAFSPCPNDTFIFDALINNKIDRGGIDFTVALEDVETLNKNAKEGRYDISKISFGAYPLVYQKYNLLNSGSALGKGVGPLLIAAKAEELSNVENNIVAIPGEHTTAHFLFSAAFPLAKQKIFLRYDEIEDFVLNGNGMGVIIHENRFTYQQKGLVKLMDLGDYWEKKTQKLIPLGGIVMRRSFDMALKKKVDQLIRNSIEYAFKNSTGLNAYIRDHALEMDDETMKKHIDLYVNEYSLNLGADGKSAIKSMMNYLEFAKEDVDSGTSFFYD